MKSLLFLSLTISCCIASKTATAAPAYKLTDLGSSYFSDNLRVSATGAPFIQNLSQFATAQFRPSDVNSSGKIIGTSGSYSGDFRAALYEINDSGSAVFVRNLPFFAPTPFWSLGLDINENGDFLGGNTGGIDISLQILSGSGELFVPGGTSYRMPSFNDQWQIVGADVSGRSFFQDSIGRYDLSSLVVNTFQFSILAPTDINNAGFVVGYGRNGQGQNSAFLLSPVPEPSSLAFTLSGLSALYVLLYTRRRQPE